MIVLVLSCHLVSVVLQELEDQIIRMHERGMKRIKPMFIPKALSNMGAGNIALKIGAQGVCKSVTTACASANDAIGEAFREIKFGFARCCLGWWC